MFRKWNEFLNHYLDLDFGEEDPRSKRRLSMNKSNAILLLLVAVLAVAIITLTSLGTEFLPNTI